MSFASIKRALQHGRFESLDSALRFPWLARDLFVYDAGDELPSSIRKLRKLKELRIYRVRRLTPVLLELPELEQLAVFTPVAEVAPELGRARKLRLLWLDSDASSAALPPELLELEALEILHLSGPRAADLAEGIGRLTRLIRLSLRGGALTRLPEGLGDLSALNALDVSNNALHALPASMGRLHRLQELAAERNHLRELPDSLWQLSSLVDLRVSRNRIAQLPPGILELRALQTLHVARNALAALPAGLGELPDLKEVKVGGNPIPARERGRLWAELDRRVSFAVDLEPGERPEIVARVPGMIVRPNTRKSEHFYTYGVAAAGDRLYLSCGTDHDELPASIDGVLAVGWLPKAPDAYRASPLVDLATRFEAHALWPQLPGAAEDAGEGGDAEALIARARVALRAVSLVGLAGPLAALIEAQPEHPWVGHLARAGLLAAHGTLALQHPELGLAGQLGRRGLDWPAALQPAPQFPHGKSARHNGYHWQDAGLEYDRLYQEYVREVSARVEEALNLPIEGLRAAIGPIEGDDAPAQELAARLQAATRNPEGILGVLRALARR